MLLGERYGKMDNMYSHTICLCLHLWFLPSKFVVWKEGYISRRTSGYCESLSQFVNLSDFIIAKFSDIIMLIFYLYLVYDLMYYSFFKMS